MVVQKQKQRVQRTLLSTSMNVAKMESVYRDIKAWAK